jgi:uncharacterized protein
MTNTPITIDYGVRVPMRDGSRQAADVFRPARRGRHPAVLLRTPYDKLATPTTGHLFFFDVLATVRAGYAVVIQDTRGRYESEGRFRHFVDEMTDGSDSIDWVAAQDWCDGSVGMVGGSYTGATQLLAALTKPSALKAIVPSLTASEYYEGWTYQGGAFQLGFALMWAAGMAYTDLLNRERRGEDVSTGRDALEEIASDVWSAYWRLPLVDIPRSTPWLETYGDWLGHPDRDEYWRATASNERHADIGVPALHIAGWNDIFLKGSLENYVGLRAGAANEFARANQRLIVTPWGHSTAHTEFVGDLWFGPAAEYLFARRPPSGDDRAPVDLPGACIEWFDTFVKGEPLAESDPVRIFVMGANRWRGEPDWPLARARPTRWYLRADGGLSQAPPEDETADEFTYDPHDPVPTVGGQTLIPGGGFFLGPRDRHDTETRPDVLVYTSGALHEDLEVTGPLTATLHVATSAPDTDFTATLVDVYPDGRAVGLTDGILRMRYRDGTHRAVPVQPDRTYVIEIDLVATSNLFLAGHRLRVEISSSNFPRFDRNPNHGGVIALASAGDLRTARQRIFHDTARPSFVTLPVVPVPG